MTWGELDHETQAFGLATTGRPDLHDRHRRPHPRRWPRLADAQVRPRRRQPPLGRRRHRRRAAPDRERRPSTPTCSGALRGGGGNFGVVTSFEYRLHPVGPVVTGGVILYPAERARDALRVLPRATWRPPPMTRWWRSPSSSAPPAPFVPAAPARRAGGRLRPLPRRLARGGPAGDRAARARFGPPLVDLLGPMPYTAVQQHDGRGDALRPPRLPALRSPDGPRRRRDRRPSCAQAASGHLAAVDRVIVPLGGAVARVGEHDTAFSHRQTPFDIVVFAIWTDPRESDRHLPGGATSARRCSRSPAASTSTRWAARATSGSGRPTTRQNYARLVALKNTYDPTNFWRMNQNIKPTV